MLNDKEKFADYDIDKLIAKSPQPTSVESQADAPPEECTDKDLGNVRVPTVEELTLAVAGGAVSDNPAEAYRAGFLAGRKSRTTAGTSMAGLCWVCGREPQPPSHIRQVEMLREIHLARTPIFHWPSEEFARLVEILDEMGPGAYLDSIKPFGALFYSEVRIVHGDGSVVDLSRDKLKKVTR
jgi:hypothetical protein